MINGAKCAVVQNYLDNDLGKLPEPLQSGESQNGCEFPISRGNRLRREGASWEKQGN